MILGLLGDTQFTNRSPERRLDNYWDTLTGKAEQALTIFDDNGCDFIIQPGDFFDSPTVADRVMTVLINLLKKHGKEVCCVAGQHDITGHSLYTLANSPLAVLQAARVVKIVDKNCYSLGTFAPPKHDDVHVYGASFGEEVPKPFDYGYNILVIHKMIGNRPLYPGQDLIDPKRFLKKYLGFNLIVCGDYHYRFIETWNGRTIINPGALVRKTISKFDLEHKPAVVIFDTKTDTSKVIELDVEPPERVFDLTRTKKKDLNVLLRFIERLKNRGKEIVGWKHLLLELLEERKESLEVRNIIDECLEEIQNDRDN